MFPAPPMLSAQPMLVIGTIQRVVIPFLVVLFLISIPSLFIPLSVYGQTTATDGIALMIVIDDSGSMFPSASHVGNDVGNLRYAAARLIMDVADDWDEIGIVCFGNNVRTMRTLAPLGAASGRSALTSQITVDNCNDKGSTNIGQGIDAAIRQLQASTVPRKYILILTDGQPTDGNASLQAANEAQQQGITVIPVELGENPNFLSGIDIPSRYIRDASQLLPTFAQVYSELKPDRYVEVLNATSPELRVTSVQQVNRFDIVINPSQSIIDNGTNRTCPGDPSCQADSIASPQYYLLPITQQPIEGVWEIAPGSTAVIIARSNFRPALDYPPTDDPTQVGYYITRGSSQTIVARITTSSDAQDVSMNGQSGGFKVRDSQNLLIFERFSDEQSQVAIQLGSGSIPLRVKKDFPLAPVPDQESNLPRLRPVNPDQQGQLQQEANTQVRVIVEIEGDLGLATGYSVKALVVDRNTAEIVFGPQSLQSVGTGGHYESQSLIRVQPGHSYRTLIWLKATRKADNLHYGDQLDLQSTISGSIRVQMPNVTRLEDFQDGSIPVVVTVTQPDLVVDLTARVEWQIDPSGRAEQLLTATLQDNSFVNTKNSSLNVRAPDVLCKDLKPGQYVGKIVFISNSGLSIEPSEIPINASLVCGGVRIKGLPAELGLGILQEPLPIIVSVEDQGRIVDLQTRIEWESVPPEAKALFDNINIDLSASQFKGETQATLQPRINLDICSVPEGSIRGFLIFSSNTDITITPDRIPIRGANLFGDVRILEKTPVDLGNYCTLPGWFNILCYPVVGEREQGYADVPLELPNCIKPGEVEVKITGTTPPDDPVLGIGKFNRVATPNTARIQFLERPSALPFSFSNLSRDQTVTANISVSRKGQQAPPDMLQVTYTKYSWSNVLKPLLFAGPWRLGNCLMFLITIIFGIIMYRFFFGKDNDEDELSPENRYPRRPRPSGKSSSRHTSRGSGTEHNRIGSSIQSSRTDQRVARQERSDRRIERNRSSSSIERHSTDASRRRGR